MKHKLFDARCYRLLRRVPRGRVITYKDLAHAMGTRAYRAVGQALHRNPFAPEVPCHRVVRSDGSLGGFARGQRAKAALLTAEGVAIRDGMVRNFPALLFRF